MLTNERFGVDIMDLEDTQAVSLIIFDVVPRLNINGLSSIRVGVFLCAETTGGSCEQRNIILEFTQCAEPATYRLSLLFFSLLNATN